MKKPIKRSDLTSLITARKDDLHTDVFFITSVRAVKDGQLQLEVCQNRALEGGSLKA